VGYSVGRVVLLPGIVAFVGSGVMAQVIKHAVPRLRPSNLPDAVVAPDERIFHNSFPSGHTTTAFALAFWVFLLTYRTRYRWWGYGALLLAGLVGLSRVYRGVHYPSDVLTGAAIGMLWGALVYLTLNRRTVPRAGESPPGSASASPRV
jgi:undecaprenyl-diphosphatase